MINIEAKANKDNIKITEHTPNLHSSEDISGRELEYDPLEQARRSKCT